MFNCGVACLSLCQNTYYSVRPLKPPLHCQHSSLLPFPPLSSALKSRPMTQFTASRALPHFERCRGFGGLNLTQNQRVPKAILLHWTCCADGDLLFRNSSWTISCYLEGPYLFSAVNCLLQGGAGKDARPGSLIRQKVSYLEEWYKPKWDCVWKETAFWCQPALLYGCSLWSWLQCSPVTWTTCLPQPPKNP